MCKPSKRPVRQGFTLVEVMVALVLATTVLLGARLVFVQLADSRDVLAHSAETNDGERNARLVIAGWVHQADISPGAGSNSTRVFGGDERSARFASWCLDAGGWERECDIQLRVARDSAGPQLIALASTGDSALTRLRGHDAAIRYLLDASSGGHWLRTWGSGPTTPIAIGVVTESDTVILRIGARG